MSFRRALLLSHLTKRFPNLAVFAKASSLIFTLIFSSPAFPFVILENREPVKVEDGLLTPFWAQEYIGADLVKEEMRQMNNITRVPFAIFDSGFEKQFINLTHDIPVDRARNGQRTIRGDHGTSVANLINGPGMVSVSEVVDYVLLKTVSPAIFYPAAGHQIVEMKTRPLIISNSMGWPTEQIVHTAKEMDQMGIIWVMASGNEHPAPLAEWERTAPTISVGSYSPRGLQTISSQESDQLDILAPADEYQASIDGRGLPNLFGETSGATPLVSGSIANAKALIPSLTRSQVERLLKRTAIRSFHSWYSPDNKANLFNAYRMFSVIKRLQEICGHEEACISDELEKPQNYNFKTIPLNKAVQAVCTSGQVLSALDTRALRRNFLLNPEQTTYAKLLSCAYKNEGYAINADFYENIALIQESPHLVQLKVQNQALQALENGYFESAALRDLQILSEDFRSTLANKLQSESDNDFQYRELLKRFNETTPIKIP